MITKIKLLTATAVLSLLSACGGGGGGGSTGPAPTPVVDPKITVYQTFDLSRSVLTGNSASDGVLQGCSLLSNPATTQINLMNVKFDENRNMVRYNFILDGSFIVPNVASGCNTTGITGTITGVTLMMGGNPAYTISSLAIDAGSFKLGQQIFWGNVLKQTGRLINSQVTSATIECTDSAGKGWYRPLTTIGDISSFFTTTCR